jgi:hypothetical protein
MVSFDAKEKRENGQEGYLILEEANLVVNAHNTEHFWDHGLSEIESQRARREKEVPL